MTNKEMQLAWQFLEGTQTSVFLTGKAGTGKTTFLQRLRQQSPKRMVVLAPTGVAAINASGQTIHSFFQLPLTPFVPGMQSEEHKFFRMSKEKKDLIRTIDLLVIDEVSMVRVDILDAIDDTMRRYRDHTRPFGGVQLLLIGDLQQLAPVAKPEDWNLLSRHYSTPYFFGSHALQQLDYVVIELQHIYRQQNDREFIDILAKIRNNTLDNESLATLNKRHIPNFQADEGEGWIRLTTHNRMAQLYNDQRMALLNTPLHHFQATIEGNFPEFSYLVDQNLTLKTGAQVMFVKNDPSREHKYYNGKLGKITMIAGDGVHVTCQEDGMEVVVNPVTWENIKYIIDDETNEITEKVDGRFTALPLRLAWAITIHKSQGLTFDHAVLDINQSFAHGQVYVALSRCRSLDGLVLTAPIAPYSVITDHDVDAFIDNALERSASSESKLPTLRYQYFYALLNELFSFQIFERDFEHLLRLSCEFLYNSNPQFIDLLHSLKPRLQAEVYDVVIRFKKQYDGILSTAGTNYASDATLDERIRKAATYFKSQVGSIIFPVFTTVLQPIGNKVHKKRIEQAIEDFSFTTKVKISTLSDVATEGFSIPTYLRSKANATLKASEDPKQKQKKERQRRRKDFINEINSYCRKK